MRQNRPPDFAQIVKYTKYIFIFNVYYGSTNLSQTYINLDMPIPLPLLQLPDFNGKC